jgi:hypothetical protein
MSLDVHSLKKMAAALKKDAGPGTVLAKGLLGLGTGMALGYGGMKGIEALRGKPIQSTTAALTLPLATGALGLAAPLFHHEMLRRMRESHLKRQEGGGREPQGS